MSRITITIVAAMVTIAEAVYSKGKPISLVGGYEGEGFGMLVDDGPSVGFGVFVGFGLGVEVGGGVAGGEVGKLFVGGG